MIMTLCHFILHFQAVQKIDLPGNELCRHHAPMLTTKQHVTSKNRSESKSADDFDNVQGSKRISESWPEMPSNLVTSLRLDPFVSHTQLALLSLCYDTHKNFRASYRKSLDQQTLLGHQNVKLSSVSDHSHNKNKKNSVWTVYKYGQESMLKESEAVNTVLYMNKDLCNKRDAMKKSTQNKCDPLHLAVVFDFLREEVNHDKNVLIWNEGWCLQNMLSSNIGSVR